MYASLLETFRCPSQSVLDVNEHGVIYIRLEKSIRTNPYQYLMCVPVHKNNENLSEIQLNVHATGKKHLIPK